MQKHSCDTKPAVMLPQASQSLWRLIRFYSSLACKSSEEAGSSIYRCLLGSALGSLWDLCSLQALEIHCLYPASDSKHDHLNMALDHLTGLTSLDIEVRVWPQAPSIA